MMKLLAVVSTAALLQCAAVAAEEFSGDGNLVDKACTKEGGSLACGAACPSGCTGEYCPAVMHYCQGDGSCGTNAAPECTVVDGGENAAMTATATASLAVAVAVAAAAAMFP